MSFHRRCGRRVTLSNNNRTATRNISDFNHGLVLTADPLLDDIIFEVRIDEKNHSWSGSIEIGVTTENPDTLELPSCATKMREGTWVMSGISILRDGISLIEFYGIDLDSLNEGDEVGVVRTSQDELIFYINGESQGVASINMPKTVYGLVNLYGRCIQVSICPSDSLEYFSEATHTIQVPISLDVVSANSLASIPLNCSQIDDLVDDTNDRLRFHSRCGSLVKLSTNSRTAERRRPLDEFNNGVVMTHRHLRDNELFEIRIDKLVDKWSGSIEVGVTTHNPLGLHFPATMTNMRSGTIMMSGCGILTNGKGTRRQYGEFNLDELREGDRVGMIRQSNGNLHYYINGQDQGVAATRVAQTLWGVIDLYGMTIKVTIVDRDEREQQNLVIRRNNLVSLQGNICTTVNGSVNNEVVLVSPDIDLCVGRNDDRLTFHPICGSHATVTHSGRTALRPNASDDFNNGVVLTRRYLKPNEIFQVRLERVVTKWAGSIEMGVTTHSAQELDFPFTMTNVRCGTWMMTGNGVMHNGITVVEQYGQNLDRLQVGDRVGVVRKHDGTLHFWVNGIDQGVAASGVPEKIYGVIDLYGQAAQASIVDTSECGSPDTGNSTISNTTLYGDPPLRFHTVHGKNARITNGGLTASRPKALAEFNDAIVFSNRPLRQRELFEVVLETMVGHWSGNIEMGVTGVRPDDIQLTANATDLEYDSIILCGSVVFHNRKTIRNNIPFDLDSLTAGTRIGVMRNTDSINFYIDGIDQGPACECRMQNIWVVVDLYGQCAQVSLTLSQPELRAPYATSENSQSFQVTSVIQPVLETKHRWSCVSKNVTLSQNWSIASRMTGSSAALSRCLVFSEHLLTVGSPFEIKISSHYSLFAGCLNIGVTDLNLTDEYVRKNIPCSIKRIPANVWYISGNEVRHNSKLIQRSRASLEWLRVGDRISLELTPARTLRILINSEDMNINFSNIPCAIYIVAELQGSTIAIQVTSSEDVVSPLRPGTLRLQDSLEFGIDNFNKQDSMLESIDSESLLFEFSSYHGKNIVLLDDRQSAQRFTSYNQALVFLTKPLSRGHSVSIRVESINPKWKGTIGIGALGICPQMNSYDFPGSIVLCRRPCWVATHDYININGNKIASTYAGILKEIHPGTIITMSLCHSGALTLSVGQNNLQDLAAGLPNHIYPVFDLYGKCEKISVINGEIRNDTPIMEEIIVEHNQFVEIDGSVPQCEKANLEIHEKETESIVYVRSHPHLDVLELNESVESMNPTAQISSVMNRSVMESMSENLLLNLSIKNRSLELRNESNSSGSSSSCCLRESLQLQHNTNLNIQRSQSSQRFSTNPNIDTNKDRVEPPCLEVVTPFSTDAIPVSAIIISSTENLHILNNTAEDIGNTITTSNHVQIESTLDSNQIADTKQIATFEDIPHDFTDLQINAVNTYRSCSDIDSITNIEIKDCEYLKLVCGFKRSLVLPDAFFLPKSPLCFCRNCYATATSRFTENSYFLNNWVYFKLNTQIIHSSGTSLTQRVESSDWMRLYYVTGVDKIRTILDNGQPFPTEPKNTNSTDPSQIDETLTHLVLRWNPSEIKFLNSTYSYISGTTAYAIEAIFEVMVRKSSLSFTSNHDQQIFVNSAIGTVGEHDDQVPHVDHIILTNESGACILTALILKLDPIEDGILGGHRRHL